MTINRLYLFFLSIVICITVLTFCNKEHNLMLFDADDDCLLECSSDSICGKVIYYFKDSSTACFDYCDVMSFSSEEPLDLYLTHKADELYGESREEFGLTLFYSILFDSELNIKEVRLLSKRITKDLREKIHPLIEMSEGEWSLNCDDSLRQPYYLKFIHIRLY